MPEKGMKLETSPLSIIVPVYQVEPYLVRCIESIMVQSFSEYELILVDDGSLDSCGSILDDYARGDRRVIIVHQHNGGVSSARNSGLELAVGEYVGFVDPDDYVDKDMYRELVGLMEELGVDIVSCSWNDVLTDGVVVGKQIANIGTIMQHDEFINHLFDIPYSILGVVWNKLFKRCLIHTTFPEGCEMGEDTLFVLNYALNVRSAVYCEQHLYNFYHRPSSAMRSGSEKLASGMDAWRKAIDLVRGEDAKTRKLAEKMYLDRCLMFLDAPAPISINSRLDLRDYMRKNFIPVMSNDEVYWKTRIRYVLEMLRPCIPFGGWGR